MKTRETRTPNESLHKNISDSIANLIDIQELAARHKIGEGNIIPQEADRTIAVLRDLESMFPDGLCKECDTEMDTVKGRWVCGDPLCGMHRKDQGVA